MNDYGSGTTELSEMRMLMANPQWKVFEGEIRRLLSQSQAGVKSRALTPEKRAEHIEAVHGFEELAAWASNRVKLLSQKTDAAKVRDAVQPRDVLAE